MQCSFRYSRTGREAIQRWDDVIVFSNLPWQQTLLSDGEDISLTTVQLASSFLFSVGFHTKKSLRGNATDWYEILSQHLRYGNINNHDWYKILITDAPPQAAPGLPTMSFSHNPADLASICSSVPVQRLVNAHYLKGNSRWMFITLGPASCLQADCVHSSFCSLRPSQPHSRLSV